MATNKQRQRQVARARWERQQARRAAEAARRRKRRIVVGIVVGLVLAGLLGWLVFSIVTNENARDQQPNPPVETDVPSVTLPTEPTPGGSPAPTGATPTTDAAPTQRSDSPAGTSMATSPAGNEGSDGTTPGTPR